MIERLGPGLAALWTILTFYLWMLYGPLVVVASVAAAGGACALLNWADRHDAQRRRIEKDADGDGL